MPLRLLLIFDSLIFTFIMPIELGNIGWKMYIINASWDIIVLVLIVCFLLHRVINYTNRTRLFIGLKLKARHWKKLTPYSRVKSIHQSLILRLFAKERKKSTQKLLRSNSRRNCIKINDIHISVQNTLSLRLYLLQLEVSARILCGRGLRNYRRYSATK